MKTTPETLALQHIQTVCQGHADALSEAMQDMQLRALTVHRTDFTIERTCSSVAKIAFITAQKKDDCATTRALVARRSILTIFC
jgi:hypothetical protein